MASLIARILALPFSILSYILQRLFGRGLPYLRLGGSGDGAAYSDLDGRHIADPAAASEYFVRMLRTYGHTAVDGPGGSGSSNDDDDGAAKLWYTAGGYSAALRRAKEDNLVLMVVLTSKEHDDNAVFLENTLCTRAFKQLMQEHRGSIMYWGGDVCSSRDAHIASAILQSTTFPFIAFLSVQPMQPSRLTGSTPTATTGRMSVFSRLEGLQATSQTALESHITDTVLPRLSPFLGRLRTQKREREMQRLLREEQDRAYAETSKRDLDRVRAKEAELQAVKDREEQVRKQAAAKAQQLKHRDAWRRLTAAGFGKEPPESDVQSVRLVIRLPDGKRLIRRFSHAEQAYRLWHLVDCEAHQYSVSSPPSVTSAIDLPSSYKPELTFMLVSTFPRRVLSIQDVQDRTIGQLIEDGTLDKQVASLIVEGFKSSGNTQTQPGKSNDIDEEEEDEEVQSEEE